METEHQKLPGNVLGNQRLGRFERFKAASVFRHLIENWRVSDFHIAEAQQRVEAVVAEHLSPTGDNLPLVAQYLQKRNPEVLQKIWIGSESGFRAWGGSLQILLRMGMCYFDLAMLLSKILLLRDLYLMNH